MVNDDKEYKETLKDRIKNLTSIWTDLGNRFTTNQNKENRDNNMKQTEFDPFGPSTTGMEDINMRVEKAYNGIIEEYRIKILEVEKENRALKNDLETVCAENDDLKNKVNEKLVDNDLKKSFKNVVMENERLKKINEMLQDTLKANEISLKAFNDANTSYKKNQKDLKNVDDELQSEKELRNLKILYNNLKTSAEYQIKKLEKEKNEMLKMYGNEDNKFKNLENEISLKNFEYEAKNEILCEKIKKLENELLLQKIDHENKKEVFAEKIKSLESELLEIKNECESYKQNECQIIEKYQQENLFKYKEYENKTNCMTETIKILENENTIFKNELIEGKRIVLELENDLKAIKNEKENLVFNIKKLKNEIIDLKGNIRVFCRIRPSSSSIYEKRNNFTVYEDSISIDKNNFIFDKIFLPNDNQDKIFSEALFLSDSLIEGYNACIFAYGQTGSGKTYTMDGTVSNRGLIPNILISIFEKMVSMRDLGWIFNIRVNYIEIYNETINDLLSDENEPKITHEIKTENKNMYITHCKYINIENIDQIFQVLDKASKKRSVGYTKCNDRSSRSHSVFTCYLEMRNDALKEVKSSTLNLIDLAGSERLSESGSEGIRLKETQNINKSLSALGNVINALIKKEPHIPFRSSKLTYYLQSCLNSKTRVLMIVNISPELNHINETICSLRFAQKVSECKLGKASKNRMVKM